MSFSTDAANQVFEENFAVNLRSLLDPVQDETAAELGAKMAGAWVNTLLELEKLERVDRHMTALEDEIEAHTRSLPDRCADILRRSLIFPETCRVPSFLGTPRRCVTLGCILVFAAGWCCPWHITCET